MSMIAFIVGGVIGCILAMIFFRFRKAGNLRIDISDPEDKPYLFLELSKSITTIYRNRYVVFKIKKENYISHK